MSDFIRKKEQERRDKAKNDIHLPSYLQSPGQPRCGATLREIPLTVVDLRSHTNVTDNYYKVTCAKCIRSLRMCLRMRLSQLGYKR